MDLFNICNSDFNSEAKIVNKYEFKLAQLILKEALIFLVNIETKEKNINQKKKNLKSKN